MRHPALAAVLVLGILGLGQAGLAAQKMLMQMRDLVMSETKNEQIP